MIKEHTFKYVLNELFRVLSYVFMTIFIIAPIVYIAYFFTYETGTEGVVTKSKIKRIRFFTKLKLWVYRHFKLFCDWSLFGNALADLEKKIGR